MNSRSYDVVIVGGGMVGLTLALMLAREPRCRIAVVERYELIQAQTPLTSSFDARSTALAQGTVQLYQDLGVWQELANLAEPINKIHISQQGCFGATRLNATEQNQRYLGVVIENRLLGRSLANAVFECDNVSIISGAEVGAVNAGSTAQQPVQMTVVQQGEERRLEAALLVAADGADSALRHLFCLDAIVQNYGQMAVIANIKPSQLHQGVAYERFTDAGPMAMLPMTDNRFALVWSLPHEQAKKMLECEDKEFLGQLQSSFGYRAGALISVGVRTAYPLRLISASQQVSHRFVLLGNAAHSLHPVAGQGFNLCARDCIELANSILAAYRQGEDLGDIAMLQAYQQARSSDQQRVIQFSDKLVKLFSNEQPLLKLGRTVGLLSMEFMDTTKMLFAQQAMGQTSRLQQGSKYG